jgi:hypothetical protein
MDYFSSMYIDNELDLGEKILFIEKIRSEKEFFQETVELLMQEKLLRTQPERLRVLADTRIRPNLKDRIRQWFRPLIFVGSGFALAMLLVFNQTTISTNPSSALRRFVIFEPAANRVEVTGTFNGWQRVDMEQIGTTGYWEVNLQIPFGEHRFSYILDGSKRIADPTDPVKEKDDFGGENSILKVAGRAVEKSQSLPSPS